MSYWYILNSNSLNKIKFLALVFLISFFLVKGNSFKFKQIDSLNNSDLILVKTESDSLFSNNIDISSLVVFKNQVYYTNRNGIFKVEERTKKSYPFVKGIGEVGETNTAAIKILIHNNSLYVSLLYNGIFKLDTATLNWEPFTAGLPSNLIIFDFISCNNKLYVPTYDSGVYVHNGLKWNKINGAKTKALTKCHCIDSAILLGSNSNNLYYINSKEKLTNYKRSLVETPIQTKGGIGKGQVPDYSSFGVLDIKAIGNTVFVSSHKNGIFVSKDRGISFDNRIQFEAAFLAILDSYILMGNYSNRNGLFIVEDNKNNFLGLKLEINEIVSFAECIGNFFYIGTKNGLIYKIEKQKLLEIIKLSKS